MCGIAGFIGKTNEWKDEIVRMCTKIKHRGPDAEGFWSDENTEVVLGHRRLSILDISENGKQPMLSGNGRYVISYNGEIYNYKEIARELNKSNPNIKMKTKTDTEVLLEAISEWGIRSTLQKARGAFAFALFDRKTDVLYLARDRMGEKPLYYGKTDKRFVFSSDLACMEQLSDFHNKINKEAVLLYLQHGYIPAPYSIYENINKLEAGTILTINCFNFNYKYETYWSVEQAAIKGEANIFDGSEEEAANELKRLLKEAIGIQMVADVPVGAFLSAGIDSSVIVSLMQEISNKAIKTFTIGVESEQYNEGVAAKEIAGLLGTEHTELYISEKEAKSIIPDLHYFYSEPFADSSQIPTMLVSRLARKKVTVSLSGDGGDELFAGYKYYDYVYNIWKQIEKFPKCMRSVIGCAFDKVPMIDKWKLAKRGEFLKCKSPEDLYNWSRKTSFNKYILDQSIHADNKNDLCRKGIFDECQQNIMLMDLQMYHTDDILVKVDRASMAYSLETRIPMLDVRVIEFAWSLPFHYKKSHGVTKRVLRSILNQYIPDDLINRPKKGFSIPINQWLMQAELREWAEALLNSDILIASEIFNLKEVRKMWDRFLHDGIWTETIWRLLVFLEWEKEHNKQFI